MVRIVSYMFFSALVTHCACSKIDKGQMSVALDDCTAAPSPCDISNLITVGGSKLAIALENPMGSLTPMSLEGAEVEDVRISRVDVKCRFGRSSDGTPRGKVETLAMCDGNGLWDPPQVKCLPVKCQRVEPAHATSLSLLSPQTEWVHGATATAKCMLGYTTDGKPPASVSDSGVDNSVLALSCVNGRPVAGHLAPEDFDTPVLEQPPPDCRPVICPAQDLEGTGNIPDSSYGSGAVWVSCLNGYSFSKDPLDRIFETSCGPDGTLKGIDGKVCQTLDCGDPLPIFGGADAAEFHGTTRYVDSSESSQEAGNDIPQNKVSCKDGWTFTGKPGGETELVISCQRTGLWSNVGRTCLHTECAGKTHHVRNCSEGTSFDARPCAGSSANCWQMLTCNNAVGWEQEQTPCVPITCPSPDLSYEHEEVNMQPSVLPLEDAIVGTTVLFSCPLGHAFGTTRSAISSQDYACAPSGFFLGAGKQPLVAPPVCLQVRDFCGPLPAFFKSSETCAKPAEGGALGDTCSFSCETIDTCKTGGLALICGTDGEWYDKAGRTTVGGDLALLLSVCSITTCPDPGLSIVGNAVRRGEPIDVNANCGVTIAFDCDNGFETDGPLDFTCTNRREWLDANSNALTPKSHRCREKQCGHVEASSWWSDVHAALFAVSSDGQEFFGSPDPKRLVCRFDSMKSPCLEPAMSELANQGDVSALRKGLDVRLSCGADGQWVKPSMLELQTCAYPIAPKSSDNLLKEAGRVLEIADGGNVEVNEWQGQYSLKQLWVLDNRGLIRSAYNPGQCLTGQDPAASWNPFGVRVSQSYLFTTPCTDNVRNPGSSITLSDLRHQWQLSDRLAPDQGCSLDFLKFHSFLGHFYLKFPRAEYLVTDWKENEYYWKPDGTVKNDGKTKLSIKRYGVRVDEHGKRIAPPQTKTHLQEDFWVQKETRPKVKLSLNREEVQRAELSFWKV